MPLGVPELLIILVVVLLIFGPKKLPQLGRQLGSGMREFRDSIRGRHGDDDDDDDETAARRPELVAGESSPAADGDDQPRHAAD
jgi:sec-independent protein translocase protein TatA